ncbi:hypothetical protein GGI05_006650 [Coemansia sp. RSA 2603]|nr:hypothetical protein GGI05_006650 [Coemansia sp. RSA 2603]
MKHVLFRVGSLPVTREAAPLITFLSGASIFGVYTALHHLRHDDLRRQRSQQH